MNLLQCSDRLEFHNNLVEHNEVYSVNSDRTVAIFHNKGLLRLKEHLPGRQLQAHRIPINDLNETRPEFFVNRHTCIHDNGEKCFGFFR